jgi:SAM-dependent methyltransferase
MDLQQIKSDWTRLGRSDPLWAVLANPEQRHGGWDPNAFLATGREEVRAALEHACDLGLAPGRDRALDFGCGAGRLSAALADHVRSVIGVDISLTMLAKARELDPTGRCEFMENDREDLSLFDDASFDIVFSSLVLQHLPPQLSHRYLAEMVRVLRPGGVLIVQVSTGSDRSPKGLLATILPLPAIRFAQRRVLGYPAPMDMYAMSRRDLDLVAGRNGARVVDAVDEPMYGGNWRYTRYYLTRS